MNEPASHPWYQPRNVRRLKTIALALPLLSLLAGFFVPVHGHFSFDEWFGFTAFIGLGASALLIIIALFMAMLLRRSENYYQRSDAGVNHDGH